MILVGHFNSTGYHPVLEKIVISVHRIGRVFLLFVVDIGVFVSPGHVDDDMGIGRPFFDKAVQDVGVVVSLRSHQTSALGRKCALFLNDYIVKASLGKSFGEFFVFQMT